MSFEVEGIVEKSLERDGRYSLLVRQQDAAKGEWYGFFKSNPNAPEGSVIKFRAKRSDDGKWLNGDAKSVQVVGEAQARPAPTAPRSGGKVMTDNRQASIVMQSSSKTAVDLVAAMIAADAIPLGATKGKKGQEARYDMINELVEELTIRLYNRCTNPDAFHAAVTERLTTGAANVVDEAEEEEPEGQPDF